MTDKHMELHVDKRRSPRVDFRVRAESTLRNIRYQGNIENFSREGMLKIIPNGQVLNVLPGTRIEVNFQIPSGETFRLECEIKWQRHYPNMPFGLRHHLGLEIKNPPRKYNEFIQGLYSLYRSTALERSLN